MPAVRLLVSLLHCPYCKGGLAHDEPLVACAPCAARHHEDCYQELGRCASCGSFEALVPRRPLVRGRDAALRRARRLAAVFALLLPVTALGTWAVVTDHEAVSVSRRVLVSPPDGTFELERDLERRRWLDEMSRITARTDREREEARELTRQGWHVAELLAEGPAASTTSLASLRAALPLLPSGPSVLRDAIEARITDAETTRASPDEGWRVALLIARARPGTAMGLHYLHEALRLLPPGANELRTALEDRISEQEETAVSSTR
ncbi:MAG TPA: RING finger protein [Planctomycetota bacterium]|nr:RING finger protein [Planctomycetota bacterium]